MTRTRSRITALLALLIAFTLVAAACTSDDSDDSADVDDSTPSDATYEATIRRTSYGIPHITADDMASLSFGQGYAFAEDHLCTLADQIVVAKSESAKYWGPGDDDANINSDLGYLAMGLRTQTDSDFDEISQQAKDTVTGYTAGYNKYLEDTGAEDVGGWCQGEPWVQPIEPPDLWAYFRVLLVRAGGGNFLDFIATAEPPFLPDGTTTTTDSTTTTDPDTTTTTDSTTTTDPENTTTTGPDGTTTTEQAWGIPDPETLGSNAWAIGSERTEDGTGMLVGNPHFPWTGALRFWESQLTIPGEFDVYGASLLGTPGVEIGFNENVAWSHTVSAGNRFTAYSLDLVEGDPTKYHYDDEERQMTSQDLSVDVLQNDGSTTPVTRTLWSSHYGPIMDFPGFGWTEDATITYRDANINNNEAVDQWLGMDTASSMDEFQQVHEDVQGIPWVNTIAVSADGEAWYADTSATPNLSANAIAAWEQARVDDPIVSVAYDNGAVLLDGSDSMNEWVDAQGARDPGLVPFADMPAQQRSDYVFNANDSFWLANAQELITGGYSPLHGLQGTPRSPRTRENAVVLDTTDADSLAGEGGLFSIDELRDAAVYNRSYMSTELRESVVERCTDADPIDMPALVGPDGTEHVAAGPIDISPVCASLDGWDGLFNLDSVGAVVWREFLSLYENQDFLNAGALWSDPFEVSDPVETPSGLAAAPDGGTDPIQVNLAQVAQLLEAAGWAPDSPLGDVQFAAGRDPRIPLHGGGGREGITNVVGFSGSRSTTEPVYEADADITEQSGLTLSGYPINVGTSFIYTLEFAESGPDAAAFLTYGESGDPESPHYTDQTELFSAKDWRQILFTDEDIEGDVQDEYTVTG